MMFTVPHPLCCTTLSPALYAPPPMIHVCWPALSFLIVMASSQTSSNQTNWRVHGPSQCTPSAWFLPMMTFLRVAPDLSKKTASASPDFEVSIRQSRYFIWSKVLQENKENEKSRLCTTQCLSQLGACDCLTSFSLVVTGTATTVVSSPASIISGASSDGDHLAVGFG